MLTKASDWTLRKYFACKAAVVDFWKGLMDDERGVSGIVVAVILVLIAVLLGLIFWENIKTFVDGLFKQVTDESKGFTK